MNELTTNEARTLVQLVTYHALLQREDIKIFSSEELSDHLMTMTTHLADKYLKQVVNKNAV